MHTSRSLHLNAFLHDIGHHEAAWRLPESSPFDTVNIEHYIRLARIAEAGTFDSIFFADSPSLQNDPRYRPIGLLEPTTLLAALAVSTEHIGLIATASTSYGEPYDLARRFASIDHISGGRVGLEHRHHRQPRCRTELRPRRPGAARRPLRARRGVRRGRQEAVGQLGGRRADRRQGGRRVRRRLEDPQHRPRAASTTGSPVRSTPRDRRRATRCWSRPASRSRAGGFAARHAEAVFTTQRSLEDGQAFYADMKRRAVAAGRRPEQIVILPGIVPILGSTEAEAREREQAFDEQIIPQYGLLPDLQVLRRRSDGRRSRRSAARGS